jgi:hypothetical protein
MKDKTEQELIDKKIASKWLNYASSYNEGIRKSSLLSATHVVNELVKEARIKGKSQARKEFIEILKSVGNTWEVAEEMSDGFEYNLFCKTAIYDELKKQLEEKK